MRGMSADEAEGVDATRRTRLANERTYLAWWRSGLTAIALAIGVGRVIPELIPGSSWAWAALGTAFGVLGIAVIAYGGYRHTVVERALRQGGYVPLSGFATAFLACFAGLLGMAAIVLVLADL
jgi:putative membrane protein